MFSRLKVEFLNRTFPFTTATRVSSRWRASMSIRVFIFNSPGRKARSSKGALGGDIH